MILSYIYHQKFDGTVYTFGFGADHDAGMLAAISTQGGGVYYFIDSNEKVRYYLLRQCLFVYTVRLLNITCIMIGFKLP